MKRLNTENELYTKYKELIDTEWDYEKNKGLDPKKMYVASSIKVWWKCSKCGRSWQAKIANRTILNSGCPHCATNRQRKVRQYTLDGVCIAEYNSISEAAKETHTTVSAISFCCHGKLKSSCGYVWKFAEV